MKEKGWHHTITNRRIKKLNDLGFVWFKDDADAKRIAGKASTKNTQWITRKLGQPWFMVFGEMEKARKEYEETGKETIPMYEGKLIAREADGTYFLIFPFELEHYAIEKEKGETLYPIVAFGA